jgi:LPS export ABC transporter protein LptC
MKLTATKSKILGIGLIFLFFLAGIVILNLGTETVPELVQEDDFLEPTAGAARFALDQFHRSQTRDGQKLWEIWAERGEYFPELQQAALEGPRIMVFQDNGDVIELTAAKAQIYLTNASLSRARVSGEVVLTHNGILRIETNEALYTKDSNRVEAPGYVLIQNDKVKISGKMLTVSLDKQEFKLSKNVESVLRFGQSEATVP